MALRPNGDDESPVRTDLDQNRKLALAEFISLRDECKQAREAQHTILQWSLGAIGVAFAGVGASFGRSSVGVEEFRLVVLGLGIPGLVLGACFAWLGELVRMERAGYFLRGRERAYWPNDATIEDAGRLAIDHPDQFPLIWENYIAFLGGEFGERKQKIGYVGGYGVYLGALCASLWMFLQRLGGYDFDAHDYGWSVTLLIYSGLFLIVFMAITLAVLWRLKGQSNKAAGVSSKEKS